MFLLRELLLAIQSSHMLALAKFALYLTLGLVASATGSIGFVVYTLQMGNDNFSWSEFCNVYNTFCNHLGFSVGVSIFATILLIFVLWTSLFSFYKRISKKSPPPQLTQAEA
ncbi:unnamed protein product [Prunus brigantina]